ncbi:helix-turn-helix domain-containing protein [Altererythrobacter sp. KTW20L]|uniref:IclR family transcriptional regulator n=1 Tax=Altererythrobacter sp. KTW20L TaxID=2942210 RepID=UPI0020C012A7|nr:IclR family transcriptional regulator C-terminal domain-containing protein [Altererythrobacter sp. KTW20L]MCL6250323.1 helix-turn-helix domain-containing protein [Altererythrobacter sp. KTW20L]
MDLGTLGGNPAANSQVKSATRTLDIIEYVVAAGRPLVAQEIATALGIPVSSLSYLLSTLVERQYLVREGRRYSAGPGLAKLQTSSAGFTLADRVAPLVRTLRVQLDETTSFFVRDGWEIEAIVTESSEQALRYSVPQGRRLPMHALAAGKALLAALAPEEIDRYFAESERRRFSEATIIDEAPLRRQLNEARRTGFAMTDEEFSLGIVGIARLVTIGGIPVGSMSVAVPKVRFDDDLHARVADLLDRAADLLEGS